MPDSGSYGGWKRDAEIDITPRPLTDGSAYGGYGGYLTDTNIDITPRRPREHSSVPDVAPWQPPQQAPKVPNVISYDAGLTLGDVIGTDMREALAAIAQVEAPVEATREHLNALITSQRSLESTKTELVNMGVANTDKIDAALAMLAGEMATLAETYGDQRVAAERKLTELRARMGQIRPSLESPVDLARSQVRILPLASHSLSLDVEYLSLNHDEPISHVEQVVSLVSASMGWLGAKVLSQLVNDVRRQVMRQLAPVLGRQQDMAGTLVLCASCTHKMTCSLAPLVLDADRSIKVWNALFPYNSLDGANEEAMRVAATGDGQDQGQYFGVVTGMKFGSAFVGMAHLLNTIDDGDGGATMRNDVDSLRNLMRESEASDHEANMELLDGIKKLQIVQQLASNINVVSVGAIPTVVPSVRFEGARRKPFKQSEAGEMGLAMDAVAGRSDGLNRLPNIGTLMTALDDYLAKAADGNSGVPINYSLKDVTRGDVAKLWMDRRRKSRDPNLF